MEDIADRLITTTLDADGVLLVVIDMPGRTMNVFSWALMDALDALMDRVERDAAVRSVVVTSGKPTFLAGADLAMVRGFTDRAKTASHDEMFEQCGRLGRQFVRLERSVKPWVAAVNGIALGGGLELALACRQRLVADDPRIQLGVPEVRWGLLPGAGGTQRLPRLAPFVESMDLLLSGRSINPATALTLGIVNAVVPAGELIARATALARSLQGQPYDDRAKFARLAQADVPAWSDEAARALAALHGVDADRYERYPAYRAICDGVLQGARMPLDEATAVEMNVFLRLMFSQVAGRMIRTLFLERLRAERELAPPEGLRVDRLIRGAITPPRAAWSGALAKLKIAQSESDTLGADTLVIVTSDGVRHTVALRVLDGVANDAPTSELPQLVLGPSSEYGCIVEVVGASSAAGDAAAALSARLWALPWRTPGPRSVLQQLRGLPLAEQATRAAQLAAMPGAGDPAFLDVAACLAGLAPAWSGGPLTWAQSQSVSA